MACVWLREERHLSEKLRIGLVGCGHIANSHVRAFRTFPDEAEIVAFADIVEQRAKEMSEKYGVGAWYGDYREMLRRDDIDLVLNATATFVHAPITIEALEAGKHVLCEKPMAGSLEDADAMIAAAEKAKKQLAIGFQRRREYDVLRARHLVKEGLLGKIFLANAACLWFRPKEYYEVWWRGTWEKECGGPTLNLVIHYIDAVMWILGPPASLFAYMDTAVHDIEVEDVSAAAVRMADGTLMQVTATTGAHLNASRVELFGERATVSFPPFAIHCVDPAAKEELEQAACSVPQPAYEEHTCQVRDLLDAIKEGRPPLVDGGEGRKSIELVTGIYRSARLRQETIFPITDEDPFYRRGAFAGSKPRRRKK
jgi:predicted dehydrogenase